MFTITVITKNTQIQEIQIKKYLEYFLWLILLIVVRLTFSIWIFFPWFCLEQPRQQFFYSIQIFHIFIYFWWAQYPIDTVGNMAALLPHCHFISYDMGHTCSFLLRCLWRSIFPYILVFVMNNRFVLFYCSYQSKKKYQNPFTIKMVI